MPRGVYPRTEQGRANVAKAARESGSLQKRARAGGLALKGRTGLLKRSPETKARMSEAAKKRWASGAYTKVDFKEIGKRTWATKPEESKRRSIVGGRQGHKPTKIEVYVGLWLDDMGHEYEYQYPLGSWVVDFYIPDLNLVVEVDGAYWHSQPRTVARDRKLEAWLREHGYNLRRVSEVEAQAIGKGNPSMLLIIDGPREGREV